MVPVRPPNVIGPRSSMERLVAPQRARGMATLLDRWQFAVTILSHSLLVPLTIGLALLVPFVQRLACGRQDQDWDRPRTAAALLRSPLPHQLCDGRCHRDRRRAPVRDELVALLDLRREHLRRPPRGGGAPCVLHGADPPRALDPRSGTGVATGAPRVHLARRSRGATISALSPASAPCGPAGSGCGRRVTWSRPCGTPLGSHACPPARRPSSPPPPPGLGAPDGMHDLRRASMLGS